MGPSRCCRVGQASLFVIQALTVAVRVFLPTISALSAEYPVVLDGVHQVLPFLRCVREQAFHDNSMRCSELCCI